MLEMTYKGYATLRMTDIANAPTVRNSSALVFNL